MCLAAPSIEVPKTSPRRPSGSSAPRSASANSGSASSTTSCSVMNHAPSRAASVRRSSASPRSIVTEARSALMSLCKTRGGKGVSASQVSHIPFTVFSNALITAARCFSSRFAQPLRPNTCSAVSERSNARSRVAGSRLNSLARRIGSRWKSAVTRRAEVISRSSWLSIA